VLLRQRQEVQEVPRPGELRRAIWLAAAAAGLFALLGILLIPRAGLEVDEALFTNPLYRSMGADFELGVLHHKIPVMDIWYTGTLKTVLCWPVLRIFAPSIYAVRLPMVVAGAATIVLFFFLARTLAGTAAAIIAAVLLATDPTFLLTDTFDFGPAALEHLLLVAAGLAMVRRHPVFASLLLGLALWNKATFVWALCGLVAAALIAYWPQCRRLLGDRRLTLACGAAFVAGALPLLLFNLHRRAATLNASQGMSTEDLGPKIHQLRAALDGSGLFGFIAADDSTAPFRSSLFLYAVALAVLSVPWWWRSRARRAGVFAAVFCAVTFLAIALTRGAGTGIHHSVLLWPFPQLLVGVAFSGLRARWAAVLIAGLAISNLLVVDRYFAQLDRNGAEGKFTDAIATLSNALSDSRDSIYIADWGMYESLIYLHQGHVPLRYEPALLVAEHPTGAQNAALAAGIADPRGLFVTHVAEREIFPGVRARLENAASAGGFKKRVVETIADSNGWPVFELWRFVAGPR
jgi:hypothetical protein